MRFLIRQIDLTAAGREVIRERPLDSESLTIGRAAENDIHLPDLAVEQHHVAVVPAPGGQLRIEATGTLGFGMDGRVTNAATIDPRQGAELALGSYRLEFSAGDGDIVAVTIRRSQEKEGRRSEALSGFSLAGVVPGKRGISWAALVAILAAFLAIPIFTHQERARAEADIDKQGAVLMDASWRTGSLSLAHHGLEDNCEACHVEAFVAVRDQTCLSCHTDIGDHAGEARLTPARGQSSWGEALQGNVADIFNKPGPGACTTCHTEHEGAGRMEPTRERFCADCHTSLDARLNDTTLGNAGDFGTLHPQFKAVLRTGPATDDLRRISLAERPREYNGLRFPHELHLDTRGGVARMASRIGAERGYGASLDCADCHRPTADGVRFLPVDMETDCEACHSLVYDKVGTTFRRLSHGDVDQMLADFAAADRSPRRPVVTGRGRPGQFGPGGLYYGNFGRSSAGSASDALSPDGVCGECHIPARVDGRIGVMPVTQQDRYFAHGWFDHADHKQETCTSCHAAETSASSADLLLPDLKQCRTCHLGETAIEAEVPSGCAMCHSYHPRTGAPAGSARIALKEE